MREKINIYMKPQTNEGVSYRNSFNKFFSSFPHLLKFQKTLELFIDCIFNKKTLFLAFAACRSAERNSAGTISRCTYCPSLDQAAEELSALTRLVY